MIISSNCKIILICYQSTDFRDYLIDLRKFSRYKCVKYLQVILRLLSNSFGESFRCFLTFVEQHWHASISTYFIMNDSWCDVYRWLVFYYLLSIFLYSSNYLANALNFFFLIYVYC